MKTLPNIVKKIAIGSDHAGFELKETIKEWLLEREYEVVDVGTDSTTSCDYPVFAHAAADKVSDGICDVGILICGSGIGMSMAANKVPGVRAALCSESYSAYLSRLHNDSNVLCMGARLTGRDMAIEIVERWLTSDFEGDRHQKRVNMIEPSGGYDI